MSKLELIVYPAKILRQQTLPIKNFDVKKMNALVKDMAETMHKNKGIGLAAPQIGQNGQIVVVETQDGIMSLINPKILRRSIRKSVSEEGCLSIPGVFGLVKRHHRIRVSAQNPDGSTRQLSATGLLARVIQHEIDHLNGVLFIDKAIKITYGKELLKQYENSSG